MFKSFLHIFMAFMLTLSILAPAMVDVLLLDVTIEMVENSGDEESKKESKKEIEEKQFFYENLALASLLKFSDQDLRNHYYLNARYLAASEIPLPPPKS